METLVEFIVSRSKYIRDRSRSSTSHLRITYAIVYLCAHVFIHIKLSIFNWNYYFQLIFRIIAGAIV